MFAVLVQHSGPTFSLRVLGYMSISVSVRAYAHYAAEVGSRLATWHASPDPLYCDRSYSSTPVLISYLAQQGI